MTVIEFKEKVLCEETDEFGRKKECKKDGFQYNFLQHSTEKESQKDKTKGNIFFEILEGIALKN